MGVVAKIAKSLLADSADNCARVRATYDEASTDSKVAIDALFRGLCGVPLITLLLREDRDNDGYEVAEAAIERKAQQLREKYPGMPFDVSMRQARERLIVYWYKFVPGMDEED